MMYLKLNADYEQGELVPLLDDAIYVYCDVCKRLVAREGGLKAAKQLISKSGGTYGFEVLWENNRLDLSVEALVLKPEYNDLFTDEEREICRKRLIEFGYKFD